VFIAAYLIFATIALMIGAVSWGIALGRRRIAKRNRALAALERFDSGMPNAPGLLRATSGLATPANGGAVASPIDPNERAVWVRYVLEELSQGWVEIFSEANPAQFRLSLGSEKAVVIKATSPKTLLLRDGASSTLGDIFDEESPEELSLCSEQFAERVEAERTSRDALFRVRVQRILEGETVYVAGVVSETGDSLRLDDGKAGTLLSNVNPTELTAKPRILLDLVLAVFGFVLLGSGVWMLRIWSKS
jgi:hypothetical protein